MRFIVFDCDGTLVDSQQAIMRGMKTAWQAEGLKPPLLSDVLNIVGLPLLDAVSVLNPQGDLEQNTRLKNSYLDTFSDEGVDAETEEVLFSEVVETLKILNSGDTVMAIITGKGRHGLRKTMERQGLNVFFPITKTADCGAGKPNPQVLLEAMEEAGADATNTVIIGDTTYDILMGKNAKIKSIGVSYGYHSVVDLKNAGANMIVDNFSELPKAIDMVLKG